MGKACSSIKVSDRNATARSRESVAVVTNFVKVKLMV
jgi:hypothetical protein